VSAAAIPSLTTTPSPFTLYSTGFFSSSYKTTDTAVLSGGNYPQGTITFKLYQETLCFFGTCYDYILVDTETVRISGNGTITTPTGYTLPTTGGVDGTYQWDVSYSGDANNAPVSDNNDPNETVTFEPSPTISLVSATATAEALCVVTDWNVSAVLSGGYFPTGSITFTVNGGDSTLLGTGTVSVSGDGTYDLNIATLFTGTFQWDVSYSGDGNNPPVSDINDPSGLVNVPCTP
jgi:hypothetical protein